MTQLADSVTFEVEGARHVLRLTPGAWIELEDAGLGDINTLAAALSVNSSFKVFFAVFAAALRGGSPEVAISDDQALALANAIGSQPTILAVTNAVAAAFPKDAEGNGAAKAGKPPK